MRISTALSLLTFLWNHHDVAESFAPCNLVQVRQHATKTKEYHLTNLSSATSERVIETRLNMATSDEQEKKGPALNVGLISQSVGNQALLGSTIWMGGAGYQVLTQNANFETGLLLGVAGVLPLLFLSQQVENSESPLVAGLNLSTNMAVLRLFGASPQPVLALLVSALLGGITGLAEEVLFRGQILPKLAEWSTAYFGVDHGTGILFGAALSTLIFAVLHTNPLSLFQGGDAAADNFVLLCFQLVAGSIFATLYLTTGNLAVPIVAHALYDFYTFYKTHLDVAGQMEYAQQESIMPVGRNAVERKWKDQRGDTFVQSARESFYLMDTNRDGILSRKELRVALFSYGINLSKMDSEMLSKVADLDQSGSIDFAEFLEFVGPDGSTSKAVRNALLGPAPLA
jgi:membrane protease YdiL (CAAX protease family)